MNREDKMIILLKGMFAQMELQRKGSFSPATDGWLMTALAAATKVVKENVLFEQQ